MSLPRTVHHKARCTFSISTMPMRLKLLPPYLVWPRPRNRVRIRGNKKSKGGKTGAALFEGEVKVTADESTNSLVIISSPRDLKAVRNVIDMLDKRRPQVFVEAVIMEVGLRETIDLRFECVFWLHSRSTGYGRRRVWYRF